MSLSAAGLVVAAPFWTLAWLAPRPGEPLFMALLAIAVTGYLCTAARLAANAAVSRRVLLIALALALAWRAPLVALPERPAHDAVRYLWDARVVVPLEGASGAHLEFAGVSVLLLSWLALLHGRRTLAALAFAAAVLVKPLPLVLAPLFWRRIRLPDAALAAVASGAVTLWITRGSLPLGSTGTFVDTFRFNAPLFAALEPSVPPRPLAALGSARTRCCRVAAPHPRHRGARGMGVAHGPGPPRVARDLSLVSRLAGPVRRRTWRDPDLAVDPQHPGDPSHMAPAEPGATSCRGPWWLPRRTAHRDPPDRLSRPGT